MPAPTPPPASTPSTLPEMITGVVEGLPPRPGKELDPYLDAAEACIRRYGWSRTSPQDIAQEMKVNRTTVYRVLGSKDRIFPLLVAREVHRLIERAVVVSERCKREGLVGGAALVEVLASTIEHVRANPTIAKLLEDEPELVGGFMRVGIPSVIDRFSRALGPLLEGAMREGVVAQRDPHLMTEWMVRICLSLLFAPPTTDLRLFLAAGVLPLFLRR
jgi:AcrR family transcriptional regulator